MITYEGRRDLQNASAVATVILLLLSTTATAPDVSSQIKNDLHTLIVFFDGLRPDYITAEQMPNLYAFSKAGCYGKQHHSVFPTVTRVNAASYSTGSYPDTHGLLGNTVYFPILNKKHGLNTGEYSELYKINQTMGGKLLTAVSLGEVLQKAGMRMMVFSSGSTGQALMQNHLVSGGAVINPGLILPESSRETLVQEIGSIPNSAKPNTAQHRWITNALIRYGLTSDGPTVSAIWYSDPDGTAHSDGIGAPSTLESIKVVDAEFGRILATLNERGLAPSFNIIVSSDHGFVTHSGKQGLAEFLIEQGLKKDGESEDVIVSEGALYVKDHDPAVIRKIVSALQSQDWVGAMFTRGTKRGDTKGSVEGTLSFETIHWNHPDRIADILVDKNWDDTKNGKGYAGTSFSQGVAGHGGLSPYEIHIALLASGPSFRRNFESQWPSSNVDLAPTILTIHGIPVPASMAGRVVSELLSAETKDPKLETRKEVITTSAAIPGGTYTLAIERTVLGSYHYVDFAKVTRRRGR